MTDDHKIQIAQPVSVQQRTAMHPLVAAATAGGSAPDVETMRELMKLQREWEAGEAKKAYVAAMVRLKERMASVISRDHLVDFTNKSGMRTTYKHTTLAHAVDSVINELTECRFSFQWATDNSQRDITVTCTLTHEAGHSESNSLSAPPDTMGGKNPVQAVASTVTMLQRYTLLSLLGIATKDHIDPPPPTGDEVDKRRNNVAAGKLATHGITQEQAEAHVGRSVDEWTRSDLDSLKGLIGKKGSE